MEPAAGPAPDCVSLAFQAEPGATKRVTDELPGDSLLNRPGTPMRDTGSEVNEQARFSCASRNSRGCTINARCSQFKEGETCYYGSLRKLSRIICSITVEDLAKLTPLVRFTDHTLEIARLSGKTPPP